MYNAKIPSWVVGSDRRTILASLYVGTMITLASGFNTFWDPGTFINPAWELWALENFVILMILNSTFTAGIMRSWSWAREGFFWQASAGVTALFFLGVYAALWVPGRELIV